jgi:hypothetical protein
MIQKDKIYAVIGASNNEEKYGYKVFKDLKDAGYTVIPINPKEKEVQGSSSFKTVKEFIGKIDTAIFVTQPSVTKFVLDDIKEKGIKEVWLQPGSESIESIEFCRKNNIACTANSCIMIERKK